MIFKKSAEDEKARKIIQWASIKMLHQKLW